MPILRDNTLEILSRSPDQTLRIGHRLGELLTAGDVICMHGGLGAGKTTLARGIGHGWGSMSTLNSPTYTIINVHNRLTDLQTLYHIDAYRLENPEAVFSVGFDDVFEGHGPVLIEWPHRIQDILPSQYLWVTLELDDEDDERRVMTIESVGERHSTLLEALRKSVFGV